MDSPGKVLIVDFLLNDKKNGPMWPALFALNMLIHTKEGSVYTEEEIYGLLRNAGFMDLEKKVLLEGISTWLIMGKKS